MVRDKSGKSKAFLFSRRVPDFCDDQRFSQRIGKIWDGSRRALGGKTFQTKWTGLLLRDSYFRAFLLTDSQIINNSTSSNKENHKRDSGLQTRS